ncbi:MAG: hypothetical protein KAQ99_00580 [Candidatus Aureabacteria bacterium]|nr:hypothetical protein [Candidatus Auribacterota bacterium]
MRKWEPKQEEEEEEESIKEELKDEGTLFVKDVVVGTANALKRAGHGVVNALTSGKKLKKIKKEVAEHTEEIIEDMKE